MLCLGKLLKNDFHKNITYQVRFVREESWFRVIQNCRLQFDQYKTLVFMDKKNLNRTKTVHSFMTTKFS